ncbi:MAG TPA: serine protease [Rhodocyclaceae bacterium]|nr:serine protease [Rhodocyclaceae bacterium]
MRKFLSFLSLALLCCGEAKALEPDQVFKLISPSVWLVRTFDADGLPLSSGSAVVIHPYKLITNCHVLGRARSFSLVKDRVSYKGALEEVDIERDFCLISVADERFDAPAVKLADSDHLSVGQRVVTLGNPRALEMTLSDGLISRLQKNDEEQLEAIQTSAPFSPGSSGGGLFDMEGRLIGITQRINVSAGSQNLNFALPINWLRDLPARSKAQLDEYYAAAKGAAAK